MKFEFVGKNLELTNSLREQAEAKLSKLDRYFEKEIEAKVTFSTKKGRHKVEVTVFLPQTILRAEETTDDMYASIDRVVDVLERQVRKHKTKLKRRHQDSKSIRFDNFEELARDQEKEGPEGELIRTKDFVLEPMTAEEASLQMDLLNHNFFLYQDADLEEICVLYKRKDGNYGRIVGHRPWLKTRSPFRGDLFLP